MEFSEAESFVLERFWEKCRIAGGAKAGYNMRRRSVAWTVAVGGPDVDAGLEALEEKGLLKSNEAGDRIVLSAEGAEQLEALFAP